MEVKLYVGNLSYSTTSDDLRTLFTQAGAVASAEVVKDRDSGQSRGFGFVTMASQAEAQKAITMFNDYALQDRQLKVNTAKAKEERGGGGGRDSRGGGGRDNRGGGSRRY